MAREQITLTPEQISAGIRNLNSRVDILQSHTDKLRSGETQQWPRIDHSTKSGIDKLDALNRQGRLITRLEDVVIPRIESRRDSLIAQLPETPAEPEGIPPIDAGPHKAEENPDWDAETPSVHPTRLEALNFLLENQDAPYQEILPLLGETKNGKPHNRPQGFWALTRTSYLLFVRGRKDILYEDESRALNAMYDFMDSQDWHTLHEFDMYLRQRLGLEVRKQITTVGPTPTTEELLTVAGQISQTEIAEVDQEIPRFNPYEAYVLATAFRTHKESLIQNGIDPIPEGLADRLYEQLQNDPNSAINTSSSEELETSIDATRKSALEKALMIISSQNLEIIYDQYETAPEIQNLITYFVTIEDSVEILQALLSAPNELTYGIGQDRHVQLEEKQDIPDPLGPGSPMPVTLDDLNGYTEEQEVDPSPSPSDVVTTPSSIEDISVIPPFRTDEQKEKSQKPNGLQIEETDPKVRDRVQELLKNLGITAEITLNQVYRVFNINANNTDAVSAKASRRLSHANLQNKIPIELAIEIAYIAKFGKKFNKRQMNGLVQLVSEEILVSRRQSQRQTSSK